MEKTRQFTVHCISGAERRNSLSTCISVLLGPCALCFSYTKKAHTTELLTSLRLIQLISAGLISESIRFLPNLELELYFKCSYANLILFLSVQYDIYFIWNKNRLLWFSQKVAHHKTFVHEVTHTFHVAILFFCQYIIQYKETLR
jgi:hypothetical protein